MYYRSLVTTDKSYSNRFDDKRWGCLKTKQKIVGVIHFFYKQLFFPDLSERETF